MNAWEWLLAGLGIWCAVSLIVALILGPVLRKSRERAEGWS